MAATLDIRAPSEQTEGTRLQVLRWLKSVGQPVSENEPLIEIETDKVTVEVAAPASGVLREIVCGEQQEVDPGEVLGRLEVSAGEALPSSVPEDTAAPETSQPVSFQNSQRESPVAARSPRSTAALSPAVQRLIAERGLDAAKIRGTGEGGRITIDDVLAASKAPSTDGHAREGSTPRGEAAGPGSTTAPTPATESSRVRLVPHSPVRKRTAEHMVQSLLHTAPHVTTVFEADLSAVLEDRARRRAEFESQGTPLTLTAYFVAAATEAIRAVPEANSRWTDTALEIHEDIHIGIATAIEGVGLLVPVLRHVESMDLFAIAQGLDRLVGATREGRLQPGDLRGGTFTISNHGVSGSLLAAPIVIPQPQSAILGIGKLEKRAVVQEQGEIEQVVVRPKCYVTLTIDHRVMDGHQANRFLRTLVRSLEAASFR